MNTSRVILATPAMTLAIAFSMSSAALADLVLHFDPNVLSSQYGASGQTPAVLFGDAQWVTDVRSPTPGGVAADSWIDAEGNSESPVVIPHATQGTVWSLNGINERLLLQRNDTLIGGIGNQTGFGSSFDTNTLTTIVVGRMEPGGTGTRFLYDMSEDFTDIGFGLQYTYQNDEFKLKGFANQSVNAAVDLPVNQWFVATYAWNGPLSTATLTVQTPSGTVTNTAAAPTDPLNLVSEMRIGRRIDFSGGTYFKGNMGDVMIFNDVDDHSSIAAQLASQYFSGPALELLVDLGTQAFLKNNSSSGIYVDGYRIRSAQGSLALNPWTSLQEGGFDNGAWAEIGKSANELSEGVLSLTSFIPAGSSIPLGELFNESVNVRDLVLDYHLAGADPETFIVGNVNYMEATGLPGDFNSDGKVDAADYVIWRKNVGSLVPLDNDGDLGTPVGDGHYALWRSNFGQPASGSMITGNASVPEPSAGLMLLLAIYFPVAQRYLKTARKC